VWAEGIGDLATTWRINGSSLILSHQAKSLGLSYIHIISNAPLFSNFYLTCLHWKLLAPLHVLVLYLPCVCICCAFTCLSCNSTLGRLFGTSCTCVSYLSLLCILVLSYLALWDIICLLLIRNCLSHYGGVICFVHITSLENVNIWGIAT
jgi:hypothetical protein